MVYERPDYAEAIRLHGMWLRNERGGVRADLSDADLSDADLSDADLSDADLSGADLSGANLCGTRLSVANLRGANLRDTRLSVANLRGSELSGANLRGANLRGANLRDAVLSGANLRDADLGSANLIRADLSDANLRGAELSGANLSGARGCRWVVCGWTDHGECGRTLLAVDHGPEEGWIYHCGCFRGNGDRLQKYIEDGDGTLVRSRTVALEFCLARIAEMEGAPMPGSRPGQEGD